MLSPRIHRVALLLCASALCLQSGCKEEEPAKYGSIAYRITRIQGQDAEIFDGTTQIRVRADYGDCIKQYYLSDNPSARIDGVEGEKLFAQWAEKLCDPDEFDSLVPCELDGGVGGFTQRIDDDMPENGLFFLQILYAVDSNIFDNLELRVGPLPTEEVLGACDPVLALIEINSLRAIEGYDGDGQTLWESQAVSGNPAAETNQGAAVTLRVEAAN